MASNRHTRVSYRRKPSYFERLGNSCSGICVGICLFLFSFVILYHNEGISVDTIMKLDDGLKEVEPLDMSELYLSNGKLVHHSGILRTKEAIVDSIYNVRVHCVKLRRKVEMYQWVEYSDVKEYDEGKETRRETTYSYSTEWSQVLVLSRNFDEEVGHRNPTEIRIQDETFTVNSAYIDDIRLSSAMMSKIAWFQPIDSLPSPAEGIDAIVSNQYYYHGKNPSRPEVGDIRTSFHCAGISETSNTGTPDEISIVALLKGKQLAPYKTGNGQSIELLYKGIKSAEEIFQSELASNTARTWLLRGFGCALMFVGLTIMSRIVVTLVDWIPIVREVASVSVTLFNITTTTFLSLTTIAISWVRFRPWFASCIFAVGLIPWFLSRRQVGSAYYS